MDFHEKVRTRKKKEKTKVENDSNPTKDSEILNESENVCMWRKLCRLHL